MTKTLFAAIGLLSTHTAAFATGIVVGMVFTVNHIDEAKEKVENR